MRLSTGTTLTRPPSETGGHYRVDAELRDHARYSDHFATFAEMLAAVAELRPRWDVWVGYWRDGERGLTEAEREAVEALGAEQMLVPTGYDPDAEPTKTRIAELA